MIPQPRPAGFSSLSTRPHLPRQRLADFCEYLAAMLGAGLTLSEGLDECSATHDGMPLGLFSSRLAVALRGGASLSTALRSTGMCLPRFFGQLVAAAERAGSLEASLHEAASLLREGARVRSALLGAAAYPLAVLLLLMTSMVALQLLLGPGGPFASNGLPVHLLSRLDSIRGTARREAVAIGFILVATPIGAIGLLRLRTADGPFQPLADRVLLAVPFAGRLVASRELRLFVAVLKAFTAHGVSVEEALAEGTDLLRGCRLRRALRSAIRQIEEGCPVARALASEPCIPAPIRHSVAVGDRTGSLSVVLPALSEHYRWESDRAMRHLEELAEPVLIAVCGCVVIVFVLTVVIPVLTLFGEAV